MIKEPMLTDEQIIKAMPREKSYSLGDAYGLYILIKTNGSKLWRFRYSRPFTKKKANLSFGSYPGISLKQARAMTQDARALLANKIDPKKHRDIKRKEKAEINQYLFENVVDSWIKTKSSELKPVGLKTVTNTLDNFILPFVSNSSIKDINASLVMEVLKPIRDNGNIGVLMRNYLYLYQIMDHATVTGLIDHNPLDEIKVNFTL
jgi:hypothetical protein